ncbi:MAG: AraC family transcriptional regulator [Oleiphilaceae bacterium]|nr:AraC family transcriptional regulator [Oleiphilaceae bacterium]
MSQSPTVTLRFSQAIVQAAVRLGIELPEPDLARLNQSGERVPLSSQDRLWQHLWENARDPLIGLRVGLEIQVGHLDSVGLLLMSCDTLGDAIEALVEYFPIISEGSQLRLVSEPGGRRLEYQPGYQVALAPRAEAVLGCLVHLSRWTSGQVFTPRRVSLMHAPLDREKRYRELLQCQVVFSQPHYSLSLSERDLAIPLIQANAAMRDLLRQRADEMLRDLGEKDLSAQVVALVRQHPHWGKEKVAEALGVSGRHLNRQLAVESCSFKQLRDAARYRMAESLLQGEKRLVEVAGVLGFNDERAFARAFHRWSGQSPARFREQRLPSGDQGESQ